MNDDDWAYHKLGLMMTEEERRAHAERDATERKLIVKALVQHGEDALDKATIEARRVADQARRTWPPYNSAHEGLGVLLEEVKELQDHVFARQSKRDIAAMRKEALDVAAVALRFAAEVCNDDVGRR